MKAERPRMKIELKSSNGLYGLYAEEVMTSNPQLLAILR